MRVWTTRFGYSEEVEVPDDARLTVPGGLPGFEDQREFALIEDARYLPFRWLQALAEPAVRFLVVEAPLAATDYEIEVDGGELAALELDNPADARVLCILTTRGEPRTMTANLRAPVIVNQRRRLARQVILSDDRFSLRHPLGQSAARPLPASLA